LSVCLFVSGSPVAAVVYVFTATGRVIVGYVLRVYGDGIQH